MARERDQEDLLMEKGYVCLKCDSRMIVTDYETIPGTIGRHPYLKCFKCGSRKIGKQEEPVGTSNKKCEEIGCDRKAWVKGLCYKHYTKKHGQYIPDKPFKAVAKNTVAAKAETKAPVQETKPVPAGCEPIPFVQIFLDSELLDALTRKAKAEYRTVEQQAAYFIHNGLGGRV